MYFGRKTEKSVHNFVGNFRLSAFDARNEKQPIINLLLYNASESDISDP